MASITARSLSKRSAGADFSVRTVSAFIRSIQGGSWVLKPAGEMGTYRPTWTKS